MTVNWYDSPPIFSGFRHSFWIFYYESLTLNNEYIFIKTRREKVWRDELPLPGITPNPRSLSRNLIADVPKYPEIKTFQII